MDTKKMLGKSGPAQSFRKAMDDVLRGGRQAPVTDEEWRLLESLSDTTDKISYYSPQSEDSEEDVRRTIEVLLAMRRYAQAHRTARSSLGPDQTLRWGTPKPEGRLPPASVGIVRSAEEMAKILRSGGEQAPWYSVPPGAQATGRVVNAFAALEASTLPEVQRFRKRYLKKHLGNLLPRTEAIRRFLWDRQECTEGRAPCAVYYGSDAFLGTRGLIPAVHRTVTFLCDRYGWTNDAAVAFLLAGEMPQGTVVLTRIHGRGPSRYMEMRFPAYLTEAEVAALYSSTCRESNLRHPRFRTAVADKVEFIAKHVMDDLPILRGAQEWGKASGEVSEESAERRTSAARCQFNRARKMLEPVMNVRTFEDIIEDLKLGPWYEQLRDMSRHPFSNGFDDDETREGSMSSHGGHAGDSRSDGE